MVTEALSRENRVACYKVLQAHAEKVAQNTYMEQLQAHLKKGRKKSTFRYQPTEVLEKLVKMSADVMGTKNQKTGEIRYGITPKEAMSYIAHDYDFQKQRLG